jgi:hypothetical protein
MSFMELEFTQKERVFEVDTSQGIWYVPADCVRPPDCLATGVGITDEDEPIFGALVMALRDYLPVSNPADVYEIRVRFGYLGRYQAPGYMDATDWSFGTNFKQLERELKDMYGE